MRLPNFIVIGAPRCGTTALYYTLDKHPQVYMSLIKETNFFLYYQTNDPPPSFNIERREKLAQKSVRTMDDYLACFRDAGNHVAVGEASPNYMAAPEAPKRINSLLPDAKLIAILRQPIERAYSHYLFTYRQPRDHSEAKANFAEKLELNERKIAADGVGTSFLGGSRYYEQLRGFFDIFDSKQIHVCLYEEMQNPLFFPSIFKFLGVDDSYHADLALRYNQSGQPKSSGLQRLIKKKITPFKQMARRYLPSSVTMAMGHLQHRFSSSNIVRSEDLPKEQRIELTRHYFDEDIQRLQDLLGRDLSLWLD